MMTTRTQMRHLLRQTFARATSRDARDDRDDRYAGDGETPTAPTPPLSSASPMSSLAQAMTIPAALTAFHLPLVADVMTVDLVAQLIAARETYEQAQSSTPAREPESDPAPADIPADIPAVPDEVEYAPDDDIATQATQPFTYPRETPARVVRSV